LFETTLNVVGEFPAPLISQTIPSIFVPILFSKVARIYLPSQFEFIDETLNSDKYKVPELSADASATCALLVQAATSSVP
jgi:hypothetical protein